MPYFHKKHLIYDSSDINKNYNDNGYTIKGSLRNF